jgi:hypothetical protein
MHKSQKFCIFCNGTGLTKEHTWADWLRNYLPKGEDSHSFFSGIVHPTHMESSVKKRQGSARSRKLRIVCKSCNGGWMSDLQQKAKPILIPLINGETVVLDKEKQKIIAAWATMSCMVAEFFSPEKAAISKAEREWLWKNGTAPENWKIWVGNYKRGNWVGHWVHNTLPIVDEIDPKLSEKKTPKPNTQTSTYVVGQLYIHAFSCPFPEFVHRCGLSNTGAKKFAQIWPLRESMIAWPTNVISDREADNMAGEIFKKFDEAGRTFGY